MQFREVYLQAATSNALLNTELILSICRLVKNVLRISDPIHHVAARALLSKGSAFKPKLENGTGTYKHRRAQACQLLKRPHPVPEFWHFGYERSSVAAAMQRTHPFQLVVRASTNNGQT